MNKRGRYKVYTADNSVEVPKVSLWRKRREVEPAERSTTQLSTPTVMEASEELARISKDIDFFHKEAIQSVRYVYRIKYNNMTILKWKIHDL